MTRRLIGLGGKLRAGKDAVGDYLESSHGFVKLGMSDALNEALLKLNPLIEVPGGRENFSILQRYQELHDRVGYVEAKKNPEVRRLLQVLGTEVGRDMISQDVWVDIAEKKILDLWSQGKDVVITAIRFPNELDMIERLGGVGIWIERPEASRIDSNGLESSSGTQTPKSKSQARRIEASTISEHASENSVSANDFGMFINNDGSLDYLYENVEKILDYIEEPTPVAFKLLITGGRPATQEEIANIGNPVDVPIEWFAPPYDR